MKTSDWASLMGLKRQTVERWCRNGKMPCPVEKIGDRWQIYDPRFENNDMTKRAKEYTICYCRVEKGKEEELQRQSDRLKAFAVQAKLKDIRVIKEVGDIEKLKRKKLKDALKDPSAKTIVVEKVECICDKHSFMLVKAALEAQNREIIVLD